MEFTPELLTTIILGFFGLIPVFVAFRIAGTAAKRSSFEELQKVVTLLENTITDLQTDSQKKIDALQKQVDLLELALVKERARSWKWEDWAMKLNRQLIKEGHEPIPFEPEKQDIEILADDVLKKKIE